MYRNQTYFFTFAHQVVDSFAGSFCNRTHCDNYAFSVFSTIVIEQTMRTACDFADFVHVFFYDSRNCFIEVIARFSVLEEVVGVFSHTACNRVVRIQRAFTEFCQSLLINQTCQIFILQHFNFLDFVRSTETIEEVDEWHARFDSSKMSYSSHIHNFLYRTFAQHGETCLAARHDVLMVTKDTQCV